MKRKAGGEFQDEVGKVGGPPSRMGNMSIFLLKI